ncbi:hypothetical protein C4573_05665 [Candidatus Woesearchaeota archaeon]|nr:MAG: hypothetical protein C4573_05665 [Candidatus Woesearchaeota archaeon]
MVRTILKGCPLCNQDVKGNDKDTFFCKHCNLLYKKKELQVSKEHVEKEVKKKIIATVERKKLKKVYETTENYKTRDLKR